VQGEGGQTRGIIGIRDTVKCIHVARENPVNSGELRMLTR
jgi:UDP-sulfoquinovose synthase